MRRAALIVALGVVSLPASSLAGSCGGGGGGGGGSSGGGGGGSSSSSSAQTCTDHSDVVGYSECDKFGTWDVSKWPRLRFSVGLGGGARSLEGVHFAGSAEHDRTHRLNYSHGARQSTPELSSGFGMLELGVTGYLTRMLYVGSHVGFGVGSTSGAVQGPLTPKGIINLEAGVALGIAIPMGDWQLRGEAITGWRMLAMTVESKQGDCITLGTATAHQLMLAPRIAVDRWLTPWSTVGVNVSSDALRPGRELQFGLTFTAHMRAFDRQRE